MSAAEDSENTMRGLRSSGKPDVARNLLKAKERKKDFVYAGRRKGREKQGRDQSTEKEGGEGGGGGGRDGRSKVLL